MVILLISGFAGAHIGNDSNTHPKSGSDKVPVSVSTGGPIVDGTHNPAISKGLPPKTVVLSFDDGPDPTWTPQVLAILKKYHVPATFFVVGGQVAKNPQLLQQIYASGSEVGIHTFTHPDLVNVSPWRLGRELDETQLTLAGSAGITTYLMRPPYSSTVGAIDNLDYGVVLAAGKLGYAAIFTTQDTEDWQRPGVPQILKNATPKSDDGVVMLMHDAGGERTQTIAALPKVIEMLQSKGFKFETVAQAGGLPYANPPATQHDRIVGRVLLIAIGIANHTLQALYWVLLVIGTLVVARLLLMVFVARRHAKRRHDPNWSWGEPFTDPVSVIVPAYNEKENIVATVRSILANDHPLEVIVVDDGSTDGTPDLVEKLGEPRVRVIRQENGGKSSALNNGIANATYPVVIMIDGDTVFERDTVRRLVQPLADPTVGAVSGNVKVANKVSLIPRLQHLEYVIGFNIDRRVQDVWGTMSTIPGAAGAFRREALMDVGGLSDDTLAEDTDLTIALGRAGWRSVYEERAIAWTEAPAQFSQLWRQRYRWSYGTMQAIWKHRGSVFERGPAGRLGRLGLAHLVLFQILMPLTAPLIDLFFVYGMFFADPATTLVLWCSMLAIQALSGWYAFYLEGESKEALWLLPVQALVYRQLMYMVLVQSVASALSGVRVRWQKLRRLGGLDAMLKQGAAPQRVAGMSTGSWAPIKGNLPADLVPGLSPAAAARASVVNPSPLNTVHVAPVARPSDSGSAAPAPAKPKGKPKPRDRWMDILRAFALLRVVAFHTFGANWLIIAYPSMGVMFALAGSLMARSLDKEPTAEVVGHRLRRMLPPLWLMGLIVIPFMLAHGWLHDEENPFHWQQLLFWLVPILDPPGSTWGNDATLVLWYIRCFLWYMLLAPILLKAFRRWPITMMVIPVVLIALDTFAGQVLRNIGAMGLPLLDLFTYGSCWLLGFAHHEGMLKRMNKALLVFIAAATIGVGTFWAYTHPAIAGRHSSWTDINDIPLALTLISVGAVLLLLGMSPPTGWVDKVPPLRRLLTILNGRAMTIYLWHNISINIAGVIDDKIHHFEPHWQWLYTTWFQFCMAIPVIFVAVLAFGWVEDLGARRRPQLLPGGKRRVKKNDDDDAGSGLGRELDPPTVKIARPVPRPQMFPVPSES